MAMAFVFMMCPAGIAAALLRRYARAVPAGPAVRSPDRYGESTAEWTCDAQNAGLWPGPLPVGAGDARGDDLALVDVLGQLRLGGQGSLI